MQRKEEEILRSSESVMSRSKHVVEEQLVASCGIETSTALHSAPEATQTSTKSPQLETRGIKHD